MVLHCVQVSHISDLTSLTLNSHAHSTISDERISLASHAKTVASYLNDYKAASPLNQEIYARHFFSYIISACWRKMLNRISSWPAVGFIYHLTSAFAPVNRYLDKAIESFTWESLPQKGPGDRTLVRELRDNAELLPKVMSFGLPSHPAEFQSIDILMSAVKTSADDQTYAIYNRFTAREFHCLLTAVIIGFAKCLRSIDVRPQPK
jgi:hypothetical protein